MKDPFYSKDDLDRATERYHDRATLSIREKEIVYDHYCRSVTEPVSYNAFFNPEPPDMVNSPAHYTSGKIEVADFIEDQKLGWHLGNAVKYIARAGKKDPEKEKEDLEKAIWYIKRKISLL